MTRPQPRPRRLAFEIFFCWSWRWDEARTGEKGARVPYDLESSLPAKLLRELPFRLTEARTVLEAIRRDRRVLSNDRWIQGDVGSGKTGVAVLAMGRPSVGLQAALMAH